MRAEFYQEYQSMPRQEGFPVWIYNGHQAERVRLDYTRATQEEY